MKNVAPPTNKYIIVGMSAKVDMSAIVGMSANGEMTNNGLVFMSAIVGMSAKGRSGGTNSSFELIQDIISLGLCKISASQKSDIGLNALFIISSVPNS